MFTFDEAMDYINSFDRMGAPVTDLNRIGALLSLLGNPQKSLKFIHIAGTNGKGSVATMCSEILVRAGYRTGLFTSPFIIDYTDRIKVDNKNIQKQSMCVLVKLLSKKLEEIEYRQKFSQFEITTALAFLYFKEVKCDIVVLETGIGGRFDSTNIIDNPVVSIITSISHDHNKILGNTLKEIAYQKAGIIKNGCACILSAQNPDEVIEVIKNESRKKNAKLIIPDDKNCIYLNSSIMGSEFSYYGGIYKLKMIGKHQVINALSVIEAMQIVKSKGFLISDSNIARGLEQAQIFARAEVLAKEPLIILDGAHNQGGMKALCELLKSIEYNRSLAVIGMKKDKNVEATVAELIPHISEFICVDGFDENSVRADELASMINRMGGKAFFVYETDLAISEAKNIASKNDLLLICGSLYLASSARKIYLNN